MIRINRQRVHQEKIPVNKFDNREGKSGHFKIYCFKEQ